MSDENVKALDRGILGKLGKAYPVDQSSPTEKSHNIALANHPGSSSVTQINQLSTSVILWALGLVLLAIAIVAVGLIYVSGVAASATGIANQAERQAQNAEREARVAMNHADLLDVDTKRNEAVIQQLIVKQAVKEAIREK